MNVLRGSLSHQASLLSIGIIVSCCFNPGTANPTKNGLEPVLTSEVGHPSENEVMISEEVRAKVSPAIDGRSVDQHEADPGISDVADGQNDDENKLTAAHAGREPKFFLGLFDSLAGSRNRFNGQFVDADEVRRESDDEDDDDDEGPGGDANAPSDVSRQMASSVRSNGNNEFFGLDELLGSLGRPARTTGANDSDRDNGNNGGGGSNGGGGDLGGFLPTLFNSIRAGFGKSGSSGKPGLISAHNEPQVATKVSSIRNTHKPFGPLVQLNPQFSFTLGSHLTPGAYLPQPAAPAPASHTAAEDKKEGWNGAGNGYANGGSHAGANNGKNGHQVTQWSSPAAIPSSNNNGGTMNGGDWTSSKTKPNNNLPASRPHQPHIVQHVVHPQFQQTIPQTAEHIQVGSYIGPQYPPFSSRLDLSAGALENAQFQPSGSAFDPSSAAASDVVFRGNIPAAGFATRRCGLRYGLARCPPAQDPEMSQVYGHHVQHYQLPTRRFNQVQPQVTAAFSGNGMFQQPIRRADLTSGPGLAVQQNPAFNNHFLQYQAFSDAQFQHMSQPQVPVGMRSADGQFSSAHELQQALANNNLVNAASFVRSYQPLPLASSNMADRQQTFHLVAQEDPATVHYVTYIEQPQSQQGRSADSGRVDPIQNQVETTSGQKVSRPVVIRRVPATGSSSTSSKHDQWQNVRLAQKVSPPPNPSSSGPFPVPSTSNTDATAPKKDSPLQHHEQHNTYQIVHPQPVPVSTASVGMTVVADAGAGAEENVEYPQTTAADDADGGGEVGSIVEYVIVPKRALMETASSGSTAAVDGKVRRRRPYYVRIAKSLDGESEESGDEETEGEINSNDESASNDEKNA